MARLFAFNTAPPCKAQILRSPLYTDFFYVYFNHRASDTLIDTATDTLLSQITSLMLSCKIIYLFPLCMLRWKIARHFSHHRCVLLRHLDSCRFYICKYMYIRVYVTKKICFKYFMHDSDALVACLSSVIYTFRLSLVSLKLLCILHANSLTLESWRYWIFTWDRINTFRTRHKHGI